MRKKNRPAAALKPTLSVIIASYSSGRLLERCLDSLSRQTAQASLEVIVVDSSPGGIARRLEKAYPHFRFLHFRERKYCGEARNCGVSRARGKVIAFLDADCRAFEDWAERILKAHRAPWAAVGGSVANGNPESLTGWAAYFCEFSAWLPGLPARWMRDAAGANVSYKKKAFQAFGPLIEGTYCSDTEFHWRLIRAGNRPRFDPAIRISHHNIGKLPMYLRHEYEHGRSFGRVRRRYGNLGPIQRWALCTFIVFLPLLLLLRIGWRVMRSKSMAFPFFRACPLLFAGLVAWSAGEFVGYLTRLPGRISLSSRSCGLEAKKA